MPAAVLVTADRRRQAVGRALPDTLEEPGERREVHLGLRTRRVESRVEHRGSHNDRSNTDDPPASTAECAQGTRSFEQLEGHVRGDWPVVAFKPVRELDVVKGPR